MSPPARERLHACQDLKAGLNWPVVLGHLCAIHLAGLGYRNRVFVRRRIGRAGFEGLVAEKANALLKLLVERTNVAPGTSKALCLTIHGKLLLNIHGPIRGQAA